MRISDWSSDVCSPVLLHIGLESQGRARALDVLQRFPGGFIKCLNTVVAAAHRHYAPADSRGDVDFARRLGAPCLMALVIERNHGAVRRRHRDRKSTRLNSSH